MFQSIGIIFPKRFFSVPVKVMLIKICHEFCTYTYLMDFDFFSSSSSHLSLILLLRWFIRVKSVCCSSEPNHRITHIRWTQYSLNHIHIHTKNAQPTFFHINIKSHGLNSNFGVWPCWLVLELVFVAIGLHMYSVVLAHRLCALNDKIFGFYLHM